MRINPTNRIAALAVFILLQMALVQPASAQGTMGMLPDPMTSRELEGYADRLGLSAEQRRAVGRHFEAYHEQFRGLRDGEIADFLNEIQELQRGGMRMPSRDQMEQINRRWRDARARIQSVDEQFFNAILVVLTDDQLAMVDRVRMARERTRYRSEMSMGMTSRVHDLSETLLRMNLTPEERERVDPILADYERRLTRELREQSEAASSMMIEMFDAMEALGMDEDSMSDPEQAQRLMEESQRVMGEIFGRVAERDKEFRQMNLRSYRSLVTLLDEQRRRQFRDEFVRNSYYDLHFVAHSNASQRFEAALTLDDLTDSVRDELVSAQQAFEVERDGLVDRAIRFAAENYRSPMAMWTGEADDNDEYQVKHRELQEQFTRLETRAMQTLNSLLPDGKDQEARQAAQVAQAAQAAATQADEEMEFGRETVSVEYMGPMRDQFVPGPITDREINIYADLMQLDGELRVLMEQLHQDYEERMEQALSSTMQQLAEAQQRRWQRDPETQAMTQDRERIPEIYQLRRKATAAVIAQDEMFFDDLASVLVDVPLERARLARMRSRASALRSQYSVSGRGRGGMVDLTDIVRLLRWEPQQLSKIEPSLLNWEIEMDPVVQEYVEALLKHEEAQDVFFASMQERGQDAGAWQDFAERHERALGASQARLRSARDTIQQTTQAAHDEMISRLGEQDAAALSDAFKRRTFAEVYNDRRAVHDQLRQALNLPNLTQERREALMEVNLSYNTRYYDLTERMIELRRNDRTDGLNFADQEMMADYLEMESAYSRLTFERSELNSWAIRELRGLLSEADRELIGALP